MDNTTPAPHEAAEEACTACTCAACREDFSGLRGDLDSIHDAISEIRTIFVELSGRVDSLEFSKYGPPKPASDRSEGGC